jgi:hypothetical protein
MKQWSRLIRFLAAETLKVHIGEPIEPLLDGKAFLYDVLRFSFSFTTVGLAAANNTPIKAFEIVSSALDPSAQLTKKVLTVKQLLSPLSREQVGLVRCLGLNYTDHAVRYLDRRTSRSQYMRHTGGNQNSKTNVHDFTHSLLCPSVSPFPQCP